MMETIVSWIYSTLGNVFDWIFTAFLNALDLSLSTYIGVFPVAVTAYSMFRVLGVGLVVIMAGLQLFKFFAGPLAETKDTPIRIGVRSAIAVFMIYFGGYFIEWIVDLAKTPYDAFIAMDGTVVEPEFSLVDILASLVTNVVGGGIVGLPALSAAAQTLLSLLLGIVIGWNLLKLIIEIAERFLMVGTLAYIAPLPFATLCSQATSMIFSRYIQMFAGQCVLMTLSVWSLKLVISAFGVLKSPDNPVGWPVTLLLILAMCRIAQRIDTYMQQLGIGVGTTGGSLLDEICNMARTYASMSRGFGRGGDGTGHRKDNVLGATTDASGKVRPDVGGSYGLIGAAKGAWKSGVSAFKNGDSGKDVMKAAGAGAKSGSGFAGSTWKENAMKVAAGGLAGKAGFNAVAARMASKQPVSAAQAGKVLQNGNGTIGLDETAKKNGIKYDSKSNTFTAPNSKALSDFMAANWNNPAAREAIANTLKNMSPETAANTLFGNQNNFDADKNNDEAIAGGLGNMFAGEADRLRDMNPDEMTQDEKNVAKAFDAIDGMNNGKKLQGSISDSDKATTANGGHIISADMKDAAGNTVGQLHVADEKAYSGLTESQKRGFVPIKDATGAQYYAKAGAGQAKVEDIGNGVNSRVVPNGSGGALNLGVDENGKNFWAKADGTWGAKEGSSAHIHDMPNGQQIIKADTSEHLAEATAEALNSTNPQLQQAAINTINSEDFTPEVARQTMDEIGKAGTTFKDDSAESGQAIASMVYKAYNDDEFNSMASSGGHTDKRDGAHLQEGIKQCSDGENSGAYLVQDMSIQDGKVTGRYHSDGISENITITPSGENSAPSMECTAQEKRFIEPMQKGTTPLRVSPIVDVSGYADDSVPAVAKPNHVSGDAEQIDSSSIIQTGEKQKVEEASAAEPITQKTVSQQVVVNKTVDQNGTGKVEVVSKTPENDIRQASVYNQVAGGREESSQSDGKKDALNKQKPNVGRKPPTRNGKRQKNPKDGKN